MRDHRLPDGSLPQRALSPDVSRPSASAGGAHRPRRAEQRGTRRSFGASIGWTLVGLPFPGAGLLATRHRALGATLLGLAFFVVGGVAVSYVAARDTLLSLAQPAMLDAAWVLMAVFTVVWVGSLVLTHLSLRPERPNLWQRLVSTVFITIVSLAVTVPGFTVARMIFDTSSLISDVFSSPGTTGPRASASATTSVAPWQERPRLNLLLLGGDSGTKRDVSLGARTDTVILASIDTASGDTVLFSLPRQTARMPFPAASPLASYYPYGFTDGNPLNAEYFLNAMYNNVPARVGADALGNVQNPGAEVLKISVGEALGLPVDYYVMVNMDGFVEFVNALGGVTVNINKPVAMGGNTSLKQPPNRWLYPGPDQHLNGREALWFARGRYGTEDYERMGRQRCVINALVKQASPTKVLTNFEALTKAGNNIVETDVPGSALPPLMSLALKVKDQDLRSISFTNGQNGFSTTQPDWDVVRSLVLEALVPPAPEPTPTASPSATPSATARPTTSGSATPSPTPTPAVRSVEDECAYHPDNP